MATATVTQIQRRKSVVRTLMGSASALMVAMGVERGCGFIANLLAARLGGASSYGAYSLALSTANNIASYAGAGIGLTATRFSGEYPEGTSGHNALRQALILVSAVSALLAVTLLYLGAEPLARNLLHNPGLTSLLQIAAFSSGAMIVFECCRGYLVGQGKRRNMVLLSVVMGTGMLFFLPMLAKRGPKNMVIAQAAISLAAIGAVAIFGRVVTRPRLDPRGGMQSDLRTGSHLPADSPSSTQTHLEEQISVTGMARKVWRFGFVQLVGVVGLNAAGWWVASLVARSDNTLVQMGLFAVANQLRNLVALAPGLLAQSSYAHLSGKEQDTTNHVLGFGTFVATTASIVLGTVVILPLPYLLPMLYGKAFSSGVVATALSVATAIVHMSSAPAAARLTIVSLKLTGVINLLWSLVVAGLAYSIVVPHGASGATALYLVAHLLSSVLVVGALWRARQLADGIVHVLTIGAATAVALGVLAWGRQTFFVAPQLQWLFALAMLLVSGFAVIQLLLLARTHHWLPESVHTFLSRGRFA